MKNPADTSGHFLEGIQGLLLPGLSLLLCLLLGLLVCLHLLTSTTPSASCRQRLHRSPHPRQWLRLQAGSFFSSLLD
jgi:hypothetical protein